MARVAIAVDASPRPITGLDGEAGAPALLRSVTSKSGYPGLPPITPEAAERGSYRDTLRVVGAEGGLADLEGAFVLGAGGGQVPQSVQNTAQLVVPPGDVDMIRPERRRGDGKRTLGERERRAVLAALSLVGRRAVEQPSRLLSGHREPFGVLHDGQQAGEHGTNEPVGHQRL